MPVKKSKPKSVSKLKASPKKENSKTPFKEIHVIHNTHWDREFRASFQRTRRWLVGMMDRVIETLENDKRYISYTLDSQTIPITDYLAVRPEMEKRLCKLIKSRRLLVGPWYTLPDSFNVGGESLVRNLLFGKRIARRFGAEPMRAGYTPFNWGQPSQFPQLYRGFGIDSALFYRGISPHEADSEFIWRGPDGSELLGHRFSTFARYNWYYLVFRPAAYKQGPYERGVRWDQFDEVPFAVADTSRELSAGVRLIAPNPELQPGEAARGLKEMIDIEGGSYKTPYFLAMHGHDFSVPHSIDCDVMDEAARESEVGDVIFSNLEEALEKIKKSLPRKEVAVLEGERRGNLKIGQWTYLLPDSISARTYLKVKNFEVETRLGLMCEPLLAMASALGMDYPRAFVDKAWEYLLGNHTHDAVAGCAPEPVCADMEYRLRQALEIADVLTEDAMQHVARNLSPKGEGLDACHLIAFNSLPVKRRAIVEVSVAVLRESGALSLDIKDEKGNSLDYQDLKMSDESVFVDSALNVPNFWDNRTFRIKVDLGELPALGYKVFTVTPKTKPDRKVGSMITAVNQIENEYMRVIVYENGTVDIDSKTTDAWFSQLNYLEDRGECGNAWRSQTPTFDQTFNSLGASATIWIELDGPLEATIGVSYKMEVPESSDKEHRSERRVALPVTCYYTLRKGDPKLYVKTHVENIAADHRLRAVFPTSFSTAKTSLAETHFDVVERPIEPLDTHDWKEPAPETHPFRSAVMIEQSEPTAYTSDDETDQLIPIKGSEERIGLAILTRGLHEYGVSNDENAAIAVTLLRAFRIILEVTEDKKQELPDLGSQCPGLQEFEYAILPYRDSWKEAGVLRQSQEFNVPVRVVQTGRGKGSLSREFSLVEVKPKSGNVDGGVFSALKQSEVGNGEFVMRLFNPGEGTENIHLTGEHLKNARSTRLDEKPEKKLKVNKGSLNFKIPAKKIQTFGIEFK